MKQRISPARGARWMTWTAVALLAAGCGRNQGALPAGFTPEGVPGGSSFLAVEVDTALVSNGVVGPGVIVTVLDNTTTDGFVLYRKTDGASAFERIQTFSLPFDRTFNTGFRTFVAVDPDLQANRGAQYLARGLVNGVESRLSPVTPISYLPAASIETLLPDQFDMLAPVDTVNTDSIPTLIWEPVPNAQRYAFQVIRSDGRPFVVALTPPDGSTSYKIQSKLGLVLHENILTRSTFFWTVWGIDSGGLVVGRAPTVEIFVVALPPLPD